MPLEAEDDCPKSLSSKLAGATIGPIAVLEDELKLPVATEKTLKVAYDSAVLKLLDDALPGCGTPQPVMKRLGIDHSLESKVRVNGHRLQVHMRGMRAGVKRIKVIFKYRRHPGALGVFDSGVKPAALYGAELFQPDAKALAELARSQGQVSAVRPPVVHSSLCVLAIPVQASVEVATVAGPILRLAREASCAAAGPGDNSAAPDNLSYDELQAAHQDYLAMCDKSIRDMHQGPRRAIRAAPSSLGWAWSARQS